VLTRCSHETRSFAGRTSEKIGFGSFMAATWSPVLRLLLAGAPPRPPELDRRPDRELFDLGDLSVGDLEPDRNGDVVVAFVVIDAVVRYVLFDGADHGHLPGFDIGSTGFCSMASG
jgi:hypothetical protein